MARAENSSRLKSGPGRASDLLCPDIRARRFAAGVHRRHYRFARRAWMAQMARNVRLFLSIEIVQSVGADNPALG